MLTFFALIGNQSGWVQDASSNQPPVDCGSNVSSFYKTPAVLFGSIRSHELFMHLCLKGNSRWLPQEMETRRMGLKYSSTPKQLWWMQIVLNPKTILTIVTINICRLLIMYWVPFLHYLKKLSWRPIQYLIVLLQRGIIIIAILYQELLLLLPCFHPPSP